MMEFEKVDNKLHAENVFKLIDKDNNGLVEFEEFVMCQLASQEATTEEEFADVCMTIYDIDKDGKISKDEMLKLGFAKIKVEDGKVDEEGRRKIIKIVEDLFSKIDNDGDDALTRDELVVALKKKPELKELL